MEHKSKIKISSNRNFGLVFFTVFIIIGLWPLLNDQSIRIWSIFISIIFLVLGLLNSNILTPVNKLWFKFGIILGAVVAPVVMGLVFFIVLTPIGLIMKLFGKDFLSIKFDKKKSSYWVKRDNPVGTMKRQF